MRSPLRGRRRSTPISRGLRTASLLFVLTTALLLVFVASAFGTGTFSGTVTYQSTGLGVPYPTVIWYAWSEGSGQWAYSSQTWGDSNGAYSATAVPGDYRVLFRDYSGVGAFEYYLDAAAIDAGIDVTVTEGNDTPAISAALDVPSAISGTVTGPGDAALADIEVTVFQGVDVDRKSVV